jgi:hypothetical protein
MYLTKCFGLNGHHHNGLNSILAWRLLSLFHFNYYQALVFGLVFVWVYFFLSCVNVVDITGTTEGQQFACSNRLLDPGNVYLGRNMLRDIF